MEAHVLQDGILGVAIHGHLGMGSLVQNQDCMPKVAMHASSRTR